MNSSANHNGFRLAGSRGNACGATLVELLTVLVIIALAVMLLSPVLTRMLEASKLAGCTSHLRILGNGFAAYAADNNGENPPGYTLRKQEGTDRDQAFVWTTFLMPYMNWHANWKHREDVTRFCPATRLNGEGIFKRPASDWWTDYGCNAWVLVNDTRNRRTRWTEFGPNVILAFDGAGLQSVPSEKIYPRHGGKINVLFMGGHVECLTEMPKGATPPWGPRPTPL